MTRNSFPSLASVLFLILLPGCSAAQEEDRRSASSPEEAARTITEQTLRDHMSFLASDGLQGRDTPSPGLERAARYLVDAYGELGLEPGGEDGSFYQRYPFLRQALDGEVLEVGIRTPGGETTLRPGEDFFVAGGTTGRVVAPVVFIGADETAAESPVEVSERIGLATAGGGRSAELFRLADRQAGASEEAGAVAAVHVLDGSWTGGEVSEMHQRLSEPRWIVGDVDPSFPQVFVTRDAARRALADLPDAEEVLEGNGSAGSAALRGAEVVLRAEHRVLERHEPPNVAAVLPGSDPELRDEYVILSAHLDHVGVGQPVEGDSIYNGADDNASGTSALLEVGRALSLLEDGPRRSVLLLHVSGEEKGLLGSRWYSEHPTVDLDAVAANVNVDMISSDRHRDTVVVIGKKYSSLGSLVEEVNDRHPGLGLVPSDDLWPGQRFFFRSDHFNFARKEVPAIFFFTGVHDCYHRPCDEIDFVDPDKAARVSRLLFHTVLEIADREERPAWDPAGLEEVRRLTEGG